MGKVAAGPGMCRPRLVAAPARDHGFAVRTGVIIVIFATVLATIAIVVSSLCGRPIVPTTYTVIIHIIDTIIVVISVLFGIMTSIAIMIVG